MQEIARRCYNSGFAVEEFLNAIGEPLCEEMCKALLCALDSGDEFFYVLVVRDEPAFLEYTEEVESLRAHTASANPPVTVASAYAPQVELVGGSFKNQNPGHAQENYGGVYVSMEVDDGLNAPVFKHPGERMTAQDVSALQSIVNHPVQSGTLAAKAHAALASAHVLRLHLRQGLRHLLEGSTPASTCLQAQRLHSGAGGALSVQWRRDGELGPRGSQVNGITLRAGYCNNTYKVVAADGTLLSRWSCLLTVFQPLRNPISVVHPQHQRGTEVPFGRHGEHTPHGASRADA
jgi:hypothetical protein